MTPDQHAHDAPLAALPPLLGVIVVALGLSMAAAWGFAESRGWGARVDGIGLDVSAGLGVLCAAIGSIPGIALLFSPAARTPRLLALRVAVSGAFRLFISLILGVTLLVAASPEGYTFLTALTLAVLACLVGEVAWANTALRRTSINTPGAVSR